MSESMLFSPFALGDLALPNRIVMAPLTRNRAAEGNVPHALNVEYYRQRASAGLIITEGAQVSPQGVGYPMTPGIHQKAQCEGWRRVTEAVHEAGGRIFIQLWHVGRVSHSSMQPGGSLPLAPSALPAEGMAVTHQGPQPFETPQAMSIRQIDEVVEQFQAAAYIAQQAGFDGVEVHAANGYLIDQFLRDGSNRRDDEYGGTLENRSRLLHRIIAELREIWQPARIGVRLSPINSFNGMHESDPQTTFEYVAESLNGYGLGYLHVMELDIAGAADFDFARLRGRYQGTYMANGGYTKERAVDAISSGRAELISFGVPYIANPDLVERMRSGAPLNEADSSLFYGGGAKGYTDYPSLRGKGIPTELANA